MGNKREINDQIMNEIIITTQNCSGGVICF